MMISLQQWESWAKEYNMLPYVKVIPSTHFDGMGWLSHCDKEGPCFVLESGRNRRYSYYGYHPYKEVKIEVGIVKVYEGDQEVVNTADLWGSMKQLFSQHRAPCIPGLPRFCGGAVGFFSYDFARYIERLPLIAVKDVDVPEAHFFFYNQIIVWDQVASEIIIITSHPVNEKMTKAELEECYRQAAHKSSTTENELQKWLGNKVEELAIPFLHTDITQREDWAVSFSKQEFMDAVRKVQEYIQAGDVFQVNLSVRQSIPLKTDPLSIYQHLRRVNPSPYMGYLQFGEYQFVSASPELLVKVEGDRIETRPIAGTRPRGANREEDIKLAFELIANDKERAEHIMLVDLERNDLGKVAQYGSVHVNELMIIEEYSHVMHIVSNVKGDLAKGKNVIDVLAAMFPGGTITGAPKIRTMEIIEELEPVRRGPYTGSFGWIDYQGNMELNIIIRTLVARDGKGYVQAGAGIVIDSDPEREYWESLNKAKALWKAVQLSEEERVKVE